MMRTLRLVYGADRLLVAAAPHGIFLLSAAHERRLLVLVGAPFGRQGRVVRVVVLILQVLLIAETLWRHTTPSISRR